jgi:acetyl-CoA acetyltransferase family protein
VKKQRERIAIISGHRTAFVKSGTIFKDVAADDLAAILLREHLLRSELSHSDIDEVIIGCVGQPSTAANIARVVALKAGLPNSLPAYTVARNCASGMEALSTASNQLLADQADILIAGGTESMSNYPLVFSKRMTALFEQLMKAKSLGAKLAALSSFRLSFLQPRITLIDGLTDPVCGLIMGITAENLAREFKIMREEQDEFALESHRRALKAQENKQLSEEIIPILLTNPELIVDKDNGPRADQSLEGLKKLKPYFDRVNGTVTVGNACPITDGAFVMTLMKESTAKARNLSPIGYISGYSYAGLEPHRMGLGPVYATAKLCKQQGLSMSDFDLIEINEAFATQVIACMKAFESESFAKEFLGLDAALGKVDYNILNVNGGAIALGHPVGATGGRLVLTLLLELKRRGLKSGLASLCIGGGQGAAFHVETA